MGAKVASVAVLVIFGAMLADLLRNPKGTGILINGVGNLWGSSLNAVAGK